MNQTTPTGVGVPDLALRGIDPHAQLHTFTLTDADGNVHEYSTMRHGASQGLKVVLWLTSLSGETMGRVAQSFLNGQQGSLAELIDTDMAKLAAMFDWAAIGKDVATAAGNATSPALIHELLRHTSRGQKQLANPLHFDQAYQANYVEMGRAVWEVLRVNRFLPL